MTYLTIGLSVLAHGVTAAPLAERYARWFAAQPDSQRAIESALVPEHRTRGWHLGGETEIPGRSASGSSSTSCASVVRVAAAGAGHAGQDAVAGVPGAIASVPDGMASAVLVGVNPVYGLYARHGRSDRRSVAGRRAG